MRIQDAISKLQAFVEDNALFDTKSHLVLGVSGGRDSMTMLTLLHSMGYNVRVAHVNFQLRGDASDADAEFVQEYCDRLDIPVHCASYDCAGHAAEHGISVQASARQLRYDWFDKVLKQFGASHICTGHHKDDNTETLLINLLRGTGLKGLAGIPLVRGNITRPLLCFTRAELDSLIATENIQYREDISNADNKYLRNSVRNRLLPMIEEIKPGSSKILLANIERFTRQLDNLKTLHDTHAIANLECTEDGVLKIPLSLLLDFPHPGQELHDLVAHLGYNLTQCQDLLRPGVRTGASTSTAKYVMLRDRDYILVRSAKHSVNSEVATVSVGEKTQCGEGSLSLETMDKDFELSRDPFIELIAGSALDGALTVRGWQHGDRIQPFGMQGQKKVSDLLIDRKVSQFDKSRVQVLLCDDQVVWVVGICLSETARVSADTSRIVQALWTPRSSQSD